MRLYIDSADLVSVGALLKTGVFYGVTTNPLILKQAGVPMKHLSQLADRVSALGARELFLQSWGEDVPSLQEHGLMLAGFGDKVVVKLPATREGFEAAARLVREGVRVCITAIYSPYQAVIAAAVGAVCVAPYLGRMNDAGRDGHQMIGQMALALRRIESQCEILAASVRTPEDVARLAEEGVRCITVSPTVAERLFHDPLTLEAAKAFEAAAGKVE